MSSILKPLFDLTRSNIRVTRPSMTAIPTRSRVTAAPKQYHASERLCTPSLPKSRRAIDMRKQAAIIETQPKSLRANSTFHILSVH